MSKTALAWIYLWLWFISNAALAMVLELGATYPALSDTPTLKLRSTEVIMATLTDSLKNMISSAANAAGVPVGLYTGLVQQESSFNPYAVSSAGAYGYAQLMPGTAGDLGVNAYDSQSNLNGGAKYLRQMYDKFGNWGDAVAAYNAGPATWSKVLAGKTSPPSETQSYVPAVMGYAKQYGFTLDNYGKPSVTSPTQAADQANASKGAGVGADNQQSYLSGLIAKIFGPALPNVGLATPLWGSNAPSNPAASVANDPNDPLHGQSAEVISEFASIGKLFTAEFWRNASASIVVLLVAILFVGFGVYRTISTK